MDIARLEMQIHVGDGHFVSSISEMMLSLNN